MKKKSFILYTELAPQVEMLSDEEAGLLLKSIFRYVDTGEEQKIDNRIVAITFTQIKTHLDKCQDKYEEICRKRTEAVNKRWDRYKSIQENTNEYKSIQNIQMNTNRTDNDNDNEKKERLSIDSTKKEDVAACAAPPIELLEKRKKKFYDALIPYVERYGKDMVREFYDYWTEPNKSKTKMRFELERTWDLGRRLGTWDRNNSKYNRNYGNNTTDNAAARANEAAAIIARLAAEDDAR